MDAGRGFGKSATDPQEIRQSAFERMQDSDFKLDLAEAVMFLVVWKPLTSRKTEKGGGFEYVSCSTWENDPIEEYIFQMGWNHQLALCMTFTC